MTCPILSFIFNRNGKEGAAIRKVLGIIATILLLSGCVKADMGIQLNKNGSGTSIIRMGVEEEIISMTNEDVMGEMEEEFTEDGYEVKEYDFGDEKYKGIEATKPFKDINKFSFNDDEEASFEWTTKQSLFKKTYIFRGTADPDNLGQLDEADQMMMNQLKLNFFLQLPFSPTDHNATEVDGKQLTWEMDFNDTNEIYAEGSQPNYITFGVLGVIILAGIVFVIQRRKTEPDQTE